MKFVTVPNTDLDVSAICLGSVSLGVGVLQGDATFALLDEFAALGGNFLDTAHIYSDWIPGEKSRSEKVIGAWLKRSGQPMIVATKGAHPELASMEVSRLSPAELRQDIDESLDALQIDCIDLYWLHRDDRTIPVGAILEPLNEQIRAGKIRYLGCSNWSAGRIQEAQDYAASHQIAGFVANQPMWSLATVNTDRMPDKTLTVMDDETRTFHRRSGMALMPYSSQAQGYFSKLAAGRAVSDTLVQLYENAENFRRLERLRLLADRHAVSINEIVLAYLLCQPCTTIPVVGCKTVDHLHETLKALDVTITPEEIAYLERGEPAIG